MMYKYLYIGLALLYATVSMETRCVAKGIGSVNRLTKSIFASPSLVIDTPIVLVSPENQAGLPAGSTFRDSIYYMESTTSPNLSAFEVKLYFDPSVITCDRLVDTTFLGTGLYARKEVNNTGGWIWIAFASTSGAADGNGVLFSIVWRVVVSGRGSILHLGFTDLVDVNINQIQHKRADGYYNSSSILILSPTGGEHWLMGNSHGINWLSAGFPGGVFLELYKGGVWNSGIISSTPNDSLYSWTISPTQEPDSDYKVRVTSEGASSIYGYSSTDFTIYRNIQVLSPNGGEWWRVDSTYDIKWVTTGLIGDVRIWYFNGTGWVIVTSATPDDGVYSWKVPNTPTTKARVWVFWKEEAIPSTLGDSSDATFTIATGPPGIEENVKLQSDKPILKIYPDPFTKSTVISYQLAVASIRDPASIIQLTIYDLTGRLIKSFPINTNPDLSGLTTVTWDGKDDNGKLLPSGIYFYRLQVGEKSMTRRMHLLK